MKSPLKSSIIHLSIIYLIFLLPSPLLSQYFSLGQEPSSVKWNQISTEHFRVLSSEEFTNEALNVAWSLEKAYIPVSASLNTSPKRMPVILNDQSVYSNAMVPYAPRRMEFFITPPQDTYGQPWLTQLILHESRHSVQYSKMYQGFTKGLYYLFGEQAIAGIYGAFVPFWFIEGDATVIETALSRTGRGRVPSFLMKLHAQWAEQGIYHYDKAYNGSFKDFVPDHYELGYAMVAGTRSRYGSGAFSNTLDQVARKPFTFVPFTRGLKNNTGFGKVNLYKSVTDSLAYLWSAIDKDIEFSDYNQVTKTGKFYTEYLLTRFIDDTTVFALKRGLDDINRIVHINIVSGDETILTTPGIHMMEYSLSTDGKYIYWSERVSDPRWDKRDYSEIIKYNIASGKRKHLTRKSRYFSPDISPDGRMIAAVQVTPSNQYSIVILDATDGNVLTEINTDDNNFLMTPSWSEDGSKITAVALNESGKSILIARIDGSLTDYIMPFAPIEISEPSFSGMDIVFTGGYGGTDNICRYQANTGRISRITSVPFGANYGRVTPDKKNLLFSNYTAMGYSLAITPLDGLDVPVGEVKDRSIGLDKAITEQEGYIFEEMYYRDSIPDQFTDIKRYRRVSHLFNLHSWAPLSIDIDNSDVFPGVTFMSQNLLSSSFTTFGYQYNTNENGWKTYLNYSYQGLYPIFDLEADYGFRRRSFIDKEDKEAEIRWFETNITPSIRVPFDFTRDKWFWGIQPYIGFTFTDPDMVEGIPYTFKYQQMTSLTYQVSAYQQTEMSLKDLYPKWGQSIGASFQHTTAQASIYSSILAAEGYLYFPGFIKHQGTRIYAGYQDRNGEYPFSDVIIMPRGNLYLHSDEILSLKLDYVFPLFYPDWRLGPVMYIKRFRSRVFADHGIPLNSKEEPVTSLGIDLTADFHLFSFFAPFNSGARMIYLPDNGSISFQFIIDFALAPVN